MFVAMSDLQFAPAALAAAWAGAAAFSAAFMTVGGLRGSATVAGHPGEAGESLDLAQMVRDEASRLAPLASERHTRVILALTDGLPVSGDGTDAAAQVRGILGAAVEVSAGGTVLACVSRVGSRRQLAVLADGCVSLEALESRLRTVAQSAALRGGSLEVEHLPGDEGARIVLRLPAPARRPSALTVEASESAEATTPVPAAMPRRELALERVAWSDPPAR